MDKTRVALITGSTRGIGEATAVEFLKNGDKVVVFCRHQKHGEEAFGRLLEFGSEENILVLSGDVREASDVQRIVDETLKKFAAIDILINNAGMAVWKDIEQTSEQEWDDVLNTNLKGSFLFSKAVLPQMKKQDSGMIINISSGLGKKAEAKYSAYAASKFGLIALTQATAAETAESGIKAYAVLPGAVATKLHLDIHPWEDPKTMMTPDHIGKAIFRLAQGRKSSSYELEVYK